jgi:hypothetical protein
VQRAGKAAGYEGAQGRVRPEEAKAMHQPRPQLSPVHAERLAQLAAAIGIPRRPAGVSFASRSSRSGSRCDRRRCSGQRRA